EDRGSTPLASNPQVRQRQSDQTGNETGNTSADVQGSPCMRIENHVAANFPFVGSSYIKPETFRLPKPGKADPHFGLSRTFYYELEAAGKIRFIRVRKRGNARGITLIPFDEVWSYLRGCPR
ncbi:MAG TPA: hypothetical protein VLK33_03750, partial [Terriglobales bacterium]|nr:hypothetical protein [Terriglobales bacterium]